jgi:hypothetical protein
VRGVATRGSQIAVTVWWFDSVLWGWSSFDCYLDDNFGNEADSRSLVAGVARPSHTREEESNGGCARPSCVVVARTQCFSLCRIFVAAVLRRRVLHGGGPFGVVVPALFASLSTPDHTGDLLTTRVRFVGGPMVCVSSFSTVVVMCRGSVVLMSQSNRR